MAVATSTLVALGLAAASAGTQYYNTQQTAKRTDRALATSIRNQGEKERQATGRVNEEVEKLKGSTADASRRKSLDSYMETLLRNRGKSDNGLIGQPGGEAFQQAAARASEGVQDYGTTTADLMSRIDAPTMQRQQEAFGYGNLATDLGLIGREAKGMAFLDDLRYRKASQRNAGLDALSALLSGAAGGVAGMGGGAGGTAAFAAPSGLTYSVPVTKTGAGWHNAYGARR